jgi:tetratricopeptide (TPR) repeat protein
LEDYNRLIELNERYTPAYSGRSVALQRLNRHREAIDDLTRAIELSPDNDPTPRNNRAYARAIAGIELDEGLADVEQALKRVQQDLDDLNAVPNLPNHFRLRRFQIRPQTMPQHEKAMYLDTRGTLYLLKGRYAEALRDLDEAIQLAEESARMTFDPSPRSQRHTAQELSVMYHHRGQIHQMLGHVQEAQADLGKGQELGYDPAHGVY